MSQTTKKNDWKERELGAFWVREGKNGKFLTGKLTFKGEFGGEEVIECVGYYHKAEDENDRKPNLQIYRSLPREENGNGGGSATSKPTKKATKPKQVEEEAPF